MDNILTKQDKDSLILEFHKLINHIEKTDEEIQKIMIDIMNGSISTVEKVFERLNMIQMKNR